MVSAQNHLHMLNFTTDFLLLHIVLHKLNMLMDCQWICIVIILAHFRHVTVNSHPKQPLTRPPSMFSTWSVHSYQTRHLTEILPIIVSRCMRGKVVRSYAWCHTKQFGRIHSDMSRHWQSKVSKLEGVFCKCCECQKVVNTYSPFISVVPVSDSIRSGIGEKTQCTLVSDI